MTTVFYAWELGANLGHIGAFLPLARALRERGHAVHWAVARTHEAARLLKHEGFGWMQAPGAPVQKTGRAPESYGDILLHFGYADADQLHGLVVAWRELMLLSKAQVVLVDHAPTAILAARTLGLPVMLYGNGFTVPPPVHPTPSLRPWRSAPDAALQQIDQLALRSINGVMRHFSQPPIERIAELFEVQERGLLSFAELDHYANRGAASYWGALTVSTGVAPSWPAVKGPRVFAYVRPVGAHHEAVLQALCGLHASVVVYAPGLSETEQSRFVRPHLHFASGPVDVHLTARAASLGVLWGGGGVTALAFLRAGTPLLMLPRQLETYLQGLRVQALGAGIVCDLDRFVSELPGLLDRLLTDPSFASRAQAFANKYALFDESDVVNRLVERVEALGRA